MVGSTCVSLNYMYPEIYKTGMEQLMTSGQQYKQHAVLHHHDHQMEAESYFLCV